MEKSGPLDISVVSSLRDFESLEPIWNSLLQRSNVDNPFLTFEWQYTWWEMFRKGKKLYIVVAKIEDKIVGIGPFMVSRFNVFKILEFIGTGLSDYLGFIVDRDHPYVVKTIIDFLLREKSNWDLINVTDILTLEEIEKYFSNYALRASKRVYEISPFLKINEPWGDFIKKKNRHFRDDLKRNLSKVEQSGKVEIVCYSPQKFSGEELVDIIWNIEKNSWKFQAGTAHLCEGKRREFLITIFDVFGRRGWLDVILLKIDGEFVAYSVAYRYSSKIHSYEIGYKDAYPRTGNYLTWYHIKKSFDENSCEYDFLRGNESYKLKWTKTYREVHQMVLYKPNSLLSLFGFILLFKLRWKLSNYTWLHRIVLKQKEFRAKYLQRRN